MNQPSKPKQQPKAATKSPAVPPEHEPAGVPPGAVEDEAKGYPTSDRQDSETAVGASQPDKSRPNPPK